MYPPIHQVPRCPEPFQKANHYPLTQHSWTHLAVDFVTDLSESYGKVVILVVFSCSECLIPLPGLPLALFTHLFHYFSLLRMW